MVSHASYSKIKCFLICFLVVVILSTIFIYKPPIRTITDTELDAVYGIKYDGVIYHRIKDYISENPSCSVEDLRVIKGVDDMIIDQLKERFR